MSLPTIGYYVHYHGLGHQHRAEAVVAHLDNPVCMISSRLTPENWHVGENVSFLDLACDDDDVLPEGLTRSAEVPGLHYVPLWAPNCRARIAKYTNWLGEVRPALVVVDVSAEISLLTRMAGIPQIVMRQHGRRDDQAHENAYHAAEKLLAPFPEMLEDSITPEWVRKKTVYLAGFSRIKKLDAKENLKARLHMSPTRPIVVVMTGRGGAGNSPEKLAAAARQCPDWDWHVIGAICEGSGTDNSVSNLIPHGWVDNAQQYIQACDVLVTAAGHNSVMEAGQLRARMIAVAEERPFEEQRRKAVILEREKLAAGLEAWPETEAWPELLQKAMKLNAARWDPVFNGEGAPQAAAIIRQLAQQSAQKFEQIEKETEAKHPQL